MHPFHAPKRFNLKIYQKGIYYTVRVHTHTHAYVCDCAPMRAFPPFPTHLLHFEILLANNEFQLNNIPRVRVRVC